MFSNISRTITPYLRLPLHVRKTAEAASPVSQSTNRDNDQIHQSSNNESSLCGCLDGIIFYGRSLFGMQSSNPVLNGKDMTFINGECHTSEGEFNPRRDSDALCQKINECNSEQELYELLSSNRNRLGPEERAMASSEDTNPHVSERTLAVLSKVATLEERLGYMKLRAAGPSTFKTIWDIGTPEERALILKDDRIDSSFTIWATKAHFPNEKLELSTSECVGLAKLKVTPYYVLEILSKIFDKNPEKRPSELTMAILKNPNIGDTSKTVREIIDDTNLHQLLELCSDEKTHPYVVLRTIRRLRSEEAYTPLVAKICEAIRIHPSVRDTKEKITELDYLKECLKSENPQDQE